MTTNLSPTEIPVKLKFSVSLNGLKEYVGRSCRMAERIASNGYFFRAWRKHKGFTLEKLAAETGFSVAGLSQLEHGKQGFTGDTLEKLATALECSPADLLGRHPKDGEDLSSLSPARRRRALRLLKMMEEDEAAESLSRTEKIA